jgi:hypothetical protein
MRKDFTSALQAASRRALDYLNTVDDRPVGPTSSYSIVASSIAGNRLPNYLSDADGNIRNDGSMQYTYDANGHVCAGDLEPHPTSMMQYIYDAEGNRVAKGTIERGVTNPLPTQKPYPSPVRP